MDGLSSCLGALVDFLSDCFSDGYFYCADLALLFDWAMLRFGLLDALSDRLLFGFCDDRWLYRSVIDTLPSYLPAASMISSYSSSSLISCTFGGGTGWPLFSCGWFDCLSAGYWMLWLSVGSRLISDGARIGCCSDWSGLLASERLCISEIAIPS